MSMVRKLVSKKELKSIYGIPYSFVHIARLEKAGKFSTRVILGPCRVAWYADEIQEWIGHGLVLRNRSHFMKGSIGRWGSKSTAHFLARDP